MTIDISQKPVLITVPPSLDSELARFLLQHYGVDHQEKPHAFIFASLFTLWHAGTAVFPLLYRARK
jgi:glutathione S-transferase